MNTGFPAVPFRRTSANCVCRNGRTRRGLPEVWLTPTIRITSLSDAIYRAARRVCRNGWRRTLRPAPFSLMAKNAAPTQSPTMLARARCHHPVRRGRGVPSTGSAADGAASVSDSAFAALGAGVAVSSSDRGANVTSLASKRSATVAVGAATPAAATAMAVSSTLGWVGGAARSSRACEGSYVQANASGSAGEAAANAPSVPAAGAAPVKETGSRTPESPGSATASSRKLPSGARGGKRLRPLRERRERRPPRSPSPAGPRPS